ncbi:MAG: adenylyltransferase/cytidyltransferase family protein [Oscillospiraceae bacterium]|nr:adenylyltransferase/cytidyltransferase family protein [Oscillospiraceae bacterium]
MYQRDYEIRAVLLPVLEPDISEYDGYPVLSVTILRELDPGDYRVVICSPDYDAIRSRLAELGTVDCVVYHPGKVYPGRQATKLYQQERSEKKPYHIGYVAGVFDLYHLGHLKLFQRAKAMCDYLIVGVVTDAGVRDFKKTEPFIPFEERIEMVRGCRYVDEAVEIPYFHRGTIEAFEKYHFDVQFSGSDYAHEPLWLYHKAWLEERGAAMVFFPYTEGTSSSKIKGLIERNLL